MIKKNDAKKITVLILRIIFITLSLMIIPIGINNLFEDKAQSLKEIATEEGNFYVEDYLKLDDNCFLIKPAQSLSFRTMSGIYCGKLVEI